MNHPMTMNKTNRRFAFVALLLLAIASTAFAQTTTQITADFGQEFSLSSGQGAIVKDSISAVNVTVKSISSNHCDANSDACVRLPTMVQVLVGTCTTVTGQAGCGAPEQYALQINETKEFNGVDGKYSITFLRIETPVESPPDGNTASGAVQAAFVVKKYGSTSVPETIQVNLNEEFRLVKGQSAYVPTEKLKLTLNALNASTACAGDSGAGSGTCEAASVKLTISQERDEGTGVATEIRLYSGKKQEAFGYTIENAGISTTSALFRITKQSVPNHITVRLGQKFGLKTHQTASIQNGSATVAKLTLEQVVAVATKCATTSDSPASDGTKCGSYRYAVVTVSLADGTLQKVSIAEGTNASVGSYDFSALEIGENQATFVVKARQTTPETIVVGLNTDFSLLQDQTAVVKETRLQLQFVKWYQTDCAITQSMPGNIFCKEIGVFLVKQATDKYISDEPRQGPLTGSVTAATTVSDSKVLSDATTQPTVSVPYPYVTIAEGESQTVFGHEITLKYIGIQSSCDGTTCTDGGPMVASLYITKQTEPGYLKEGLNEKFKLRTGQTAGIVDASSSRPQALVTVKLEEVYLMKCALTTEETQSSYKCDDRSVAVLAIQPTEKSAPVFEKLREGESAVVGDFRVTLLDLPDAGTAVLFVERAYADETRHVRQAVADLFEVERFIVADAQWITTNEAQVNESALSMTNALADWMIAYYAPTRPSIDDPSWMYSFRWSAPELPAPLTVFRHPYDSIHHTEIIEAGYYQDERITGAPFALGLLTNVASGAAGLG
jgi:hypothetical protein